MLQTRNSAISEIGSLRAGHSFRKKPEHHPDGNVCVVQLKDILSDGILDTRKLCRTTQTSKRLLQKGDVLLINRGRFTASVFDGTFTAPCVATSAFMILTSKDPAPTTWANFSTKPCIRSKTKAATASAATPTCT